MSEASIQLPARARNLVGETFGRLTVMSYAGKRGRILMWECLCTCGTTITTEGASLLHSRTSSCGCFRREATSRKMLVHGLTKTETHRIWTNMKSRCRNPRFPGFVWYGARGITVCERWLTFTNFVEDMGLRPSPLHSLDRKNNNGSYCKGNCRWATKSEQANNTRTNRWIVVNGVSHTIAQWSVISGINRGTLWHRINSGWDAHEALTTPTRATSRSTTNH